MTPSKLLTASAAALLALTLAGCTASNDSGSRAAVDRSALSYQSADGSVAESSAADAGGAGTQDAARSVLSNGSISLQVEDRTDAIEQVRAVVQQLDGRIDSQSVSGADGSRAELSIRVPAKKFDEAFGLLGEIGKVTDEQRSSADVTMQHVDLQARIGALEASISRLTDLMAGAATTGELIEAESALSQRQAELDSLKAQLTQLEGEIDESTIWVSLSTSSALPGGPSSFWEGLLAGIGSIGAFFSGAVVVLGVLLPWAALAAIVIVPVRALRQKKRGETPAP